MYTTASAVARARGRMREDSDGTVRVALNGAIRDAIPEAGERLDHLRLSELAPQPADRDLHSLGERIRVLVPHLLKEVLRAECSRCRPHEGLQHGELFDRQIELLPLTCHDVSQGVELDVRRPEDAWMRHRLAPGEGGGSGGERGGGGRVGGVGGGTEGAGGYGMPRAGGRGRRRGDARL